MTWNIWLSVFKSREINSIETLAQHTESISDYIILPLINGVAKKNQKEH